MRKMIIGGLAAGALLAGCDGSPESGKTGGVHEVTHVDVDGRKVACVIWDGYNAGGISCDWVSARKPS